MSEYLLPRISTNPRYVYLNDADYTYKKIALLLWVTSIVYYKRRYFKQDRLMFNWALFGVGSLFASFGYASFFCESAYAAAAKVNNERELEHKKQLGQDL
eukprot:403343885